MGWNTVAVLYNDFSAEISQAMPRLGAAMRAFSNHPRSSREEGHFGCGQIISHDHADGAQVVVAGRNGGERLFYDLPASDWALNAAAEMLRWHGYAVRAPGEKRARAPYRDRPARP